MGEKAPLTKVRVDKWLWSVRLFKTRTLAKSAVESGKVLVEGQKTKPSREISVGQNLRVKIGWDERDIIVDGLIEKRVGAPIAAEQFTETPESIKRRAELVEMRKLNRGADILSEHRPTKKQRRQIHRFKRIDSATE